MAGVGVEAEEGDDLLLDQLMVGLAAGPIKQELNRQMRRSALTQGNHLELSGFKTTMPLAAGKAWDEAFAECQRVTTRGPLPLYQGVAKFTTAATSCCPTSL